MNKITRDGTTSFFLIPQNLKLDIIKGAFSSEGNYPIAY